MTERSATVPVMPVTRNWIPVVALAWLLPGGGHFLLRRMGRGGILLAAVTLMFVFGLLMRGSFYNPNSEMLAGADTLTRLMYRGGWLGDMASGVLYLVTMMTPYSQPEVAGHVQDYGTKFLLGAGLLNVLAIVDAYEIAVGKKS